MLSPRPNAAKNTSSEPLPQDEIAFFPPTVVELYGLRKLRRLIAPVEQLPATRAAGAEVAAGAAVVAYGT